MGSEMCIRDRKYSFSFYFVEYFEESKWIKDLHIKPGMVYLTEKQVGKKFNGTGGNLLNRTPMVYALRSRIDKWDLVKLQSFCKAKDTVNRTKWQPTD